MLSDQELIEGLSAGLAPLRPPEDLIDRLREGASSRPRGATRRRVDLKPEVDRKPGVDTKPVSTVRRRRISAEGLVLTAGCLAVAVVVFGAIALLGHRGTPAVVTRPAVRDAPREHGRVLIPTHHSRPILNGAGIATTTFGASRSRVEQLLKLVLGRPTSEHHVTGDCGVDRTLTWPLLISSSTGLPVESEQLTVFLDHGHFVGYQYGDSTLAPRGSGHLRLRATTTRGLALGDPLRAVRRQYGSAFRTSSAQGGVWSVQTPSGTLRGYVAGHTQRGIPTARSLIASIDAGNTGCPAVSP